MKLLRITIITLSAFLLSLVLQSCDEKFGFGDETTQRSVPTTPRKISEETRRALIVFSDGYNSLSSYLKEDISDLKEGYFPPEGRDHNLLFLVSSLTASSDDYKTKTSPVIIRMYENYEGEHVVDTIKTLPEGSLLVDKDVMKETLSFIKDNYPAKSYGMVYSSHATGYLPEYYYTSVKSASRSSMEKLSNIYVPIDQDPNLPAVKSIGQEVHRNDSGSLISHEMELQDFADALPMHLEYLLFDACLMGGVEVAYELKDKADVIGFSPAEVLADGFDYTSLASLLLENEKPDPKSICSEYFERYNARSGASRSATITLVDCSKLDNLAQACNVLFEKYRNQIDAVSPSRVQGYFRNNRHWFYDMEDILLKSGATKDDMKDFYSAMEQAILYKNATPSFMGDFDIKVYSGLSMFLPNNGNYYLKDYYKSLKWNEATSLVK